MREERAFGFTGAFDLPERVASMADAGDVVEGSYVGEEGDFFFVQGGDAEGEVVYGLEGAVGAADGDHGAADLLTESAGVAQSQTECGSWGRRV